MSIELKIGMTYIDPRAREGDIVEITDINRISEKVSMKVLIDTPDGYWQDNKDINPLYYSFNLFLSTYMPYPQAQTPLWKLLNE